MPNITPDPKKTRSFASPAAFEAWLAEHHASEQELWLRIYKKGSGVPTISPSEAIESALCWGWIDGQRKGLDETSFLQRFTPRRAKSAWSQINRELVARLVDVGRMTPHGLRHVEAAKADGRWDAAYAPMRSMTVAALPADLRSAIETDANARRSLDLLTRQHLFALAVNVTRLKTAAARSRKIEQFVAALARGEAPLPGGNFEPLELAKRQPAREHKQTGSGAKKTTRRAKTTRRRS
jgi:uncharacterized protein YdeI (YjbR/CyaY-like superfamily)